MNMKSLLRSAFICASLLVTVAVSSVRADESADFDVKPMPLKTPPPVYPDQLRRDGITGMVAVRVTIDENGTVSDCAVAKSSNAAFDRAALEAIRGWKFKPASKQGSAVKSRIIIPIKFAASE